MFARVRRSDVVLAAIALVGVLAGLALTIATKIGVTGPVLIVVGIVAAVAAAASGIRAQVTAMVARQDQQRDRLDAILVVPVQVMGEVDPFPDRSVSFYSGRDRVARLATRPGWRGPTVRATRHR